MCVVGELYSSRDGETNQLTERKPKMLQLTITIQAIAAARVMLSLHEMAEQVLQRLQQRDDGCGASPDGGSCDGDAHEGQGFLW